MAIYAFNSGIPLLTTERLRLRQLNMRDAEDIVRYSRDPLVAKYVLWQAHSNIGDSRAYIRYMMHAYRTGEPSSWGIEYAKYRRIIGTIGFMWIQNSNSCAEVGYSLAREYWNQGIMTEALSEVIRYGFEELRLNRIEAIHEPDNAASGAVMQKCGMLYEGYQRQKLLNKGKYVDVKLYAILRQDWKKLRTARDFPGSSS